MGARWEWLMIGIFPRKARMEISDAVGVANVIFPAIGEEVSGRRVGEGEFVAQEIGAMFLFRNANGENAAGMLGSDRFFFEISVGTLEDRE